MQSARTESTIFPFYQQKPINKNGAVKKELPEKKK